jgi:hypothetical protein
MIFGIAMTIMAKALEQNSAEPYNPRESLITIPFN